MWDVLSEDRTGLLFTIDAGLRQRSNFEDKVPRHSWPYYTVSDSRLPTKLVGQGSLSPRKRVVRLYPQALGSLFVILYHSKGYGGGIGTQLYMG